jgi:hypothetical protein
MTFDVGIAEDTIRVHVPEQLEELLESGIQAPKMPRAKRVGFRPVRSAVMLEHDILKLRKQFSIRDREAVRPVRWSTARVSMTLGVDCPGR